MKSKNKYTKNHSELSFQEFIEEVLLDTTVEMGIAAVAERKKYERKRRVASFAVGIAVVVTLVNLAVSIW